MYLLIKAAGEVNPAFQVNINDEDWAAGIYSCGRTAYYQNMKNDEGILRTIRFYTKGNHPIYQLLWTVTPVLHKYGSGFTSGYLKFTLKKLMDETDPRFVAVRDALTNVTG